MSHTSLYFGSLAEGSLVLPHRNQLGARGLGSAARQERPRRSGALGHRYLFAEGFRSSAARQFGAIRRAGIRSRKKSPAEAGLQKASNFQNLRLVPQMELGKGSHGRRMENPRRQSRPSYAAGDPDGTRDRRSAGCPPLSQPTVKFSSSACPLRPNAQKFL